jgi:hypothetical protein
MRKSIIWSLSKSELQEIINTSSSYKDILIKLGFKSYSANRGTLNKRFASEKFDFTLFNENVKTLRNKIMGSLKDTNSKYTHEDFLKENCERGRNLVRRFILKNNLIDYKCEKCGNAGEWIGQKITLQLEHKNGINNDNRLENLCFLCPNCHSQTPTWGAKRMKKDYFCDICGAETCGYGKKCSKCDGNDKRKFNISQEEMKALLLVESIESIGRRYGVNGNSIRKRCKVMNISLPKFPRGHWVKKR